MKKNIAFVYKMKLFIKPIACVVLFAFVNFWLGCNNYFTIDDVDLTQTEVNKLDLHNKYLILHHGSQVWHIYHIVKIDEDKKEMRVQTEALPPGHDFYKDISPGNSDTYKPDKQPLPTDEIHFYVSSYIQEPDSSITIPFDSFQKVHIYEHDYPTTTVSYTFGILGCIVVAMAIAVIIIFATKSSCPFAYSFDGVNYNFEGELFGGAIYKPLERDDYMPLQFLKPVNSECTLLIKNKLKERQYINLAQLITVEHSPNCKVLLDKYGKPHSYSNPISPISVASQNVQQDRFLFEHTDSTYYMFDNNSQPDTEKSSIALSFDKPLNAKSAKLILNLKNSIWLDYLYGKFNEKFGIWYNKIAESQNDKPFDEQMRWSLAQGIPLSIYLETDDSTYFVDYIQPVGPLAARDIIIPIDISNVRGTKLLIKLECGYMFWEIDYAAIDYTPNEIIKVTANKAFSAVQNGKSIINEIKQTDSSYLSQPNIDDCAVLKFKVPDIAANNTVSYFLHSRGYYEYIRDYSNIPNITELKSFANDGAFIKFSKQEFNKYKQNTKLIEMVLNNNKFK